MNYPTTILNNKQGVWQDQPGYWPLEKTKEELKEEIWQGIEQEIKQFANRPNVFSWHIN